MRKSICILLSILVQLSVYAQLDADRPEAFLFEHQNRLQKKTDTVIVSIDSNTDSNVVASRWTVSEQIQYKGYFSAYASAYINSNAITNSFMKSYLYTRSYIDSDMKQQQVDRMKSSNRIGADINAGIHGQYTIKDIRFEAGLRYRNFYSAQFSEDAFKLIFYGNAMFAGQSADLSPMKLSDVNYQSLYIGAKKNIGRKKRTTIGGRIGAVRGGLMQRMTSKNLSLYTAQDGSYLDLSGDFKVAYTEDGYEIIPKSNGAGLTADLSVSVQRDKGSFIAELLDLGFVKWNGVSYYEGHGTYRYDGVNIDNILANDGLTINTANLATFLDAMGLQKQTKNVTYMLPSTLHLAYFRHLNPKITLVGGVRQIFVAGYVPRVYTKMAWYVTKDFVIAPMLAYGGFGRGDVELGISKSISNHLIVSTNLFWFEYFALPDQSSGHGMSAAFSYYF